MARALKSIGPLPPEVEVVISDNSTNDLSGEVTQLVMDEQPTQRWRYFHNPPGGTLIGNWNACVERARGHYVLMLHDDDYLLPGAISKLVSTLQAARSRYEAVLFGVQVVNEHERVQHRQTVSTAHFLHRSLATQKLLTNSSFVRMPAMVVSRRAYVEAGMLDPVQDGTGDLDIWLRVCSKHGLYRVPITTAAYTVHNGAVTAGMFQAQTISQLLRIFNRAAEQQLLSPPELETARARFFHQFVLAGTLRSMRNRNLKRARQVLDLLKHPELSHLGLSLRWLPLRLCFFVLTRFVQDE
ncbi:glycosyltransferase [Hymenobacter koreensis]|uniref:Glycosyltransferase n=1 Tax=Hymenobacter koreensis TaxID=1084523 RepID=A0ABP8IUX7_9BACT